MYIPGQHKNCFNYVTIPLIFFMYKLKITLKIVAENTIEIFFNDIYAHIGK